MPEDHTHKLASSLASSSHRTPHDHTPHPLKAALDKFTADAASCSSDVGTGDGGDDDSEAYSPSPVSTVSSSGEVGGVYTLYSDVIHSDDDQDLSGWWLLIRAQVFIIRASED